MQRLNPASSLPTFQLSTFQASGTLNPPQGHRGSLHPAFTVLAPLVEDSPVVRPYS